MSITTTYLDELPDHLVECPLASRLAQSLRDNREELVQRWLERIAARVSIEPNRVFPTNALLDHVPLLVSGIADYLEDPTQDISGASTVVGKAMELGQLRHEQGFDVYQILKEYELLGGILFSFLGRAVGEMDEPCSPGELLACGQRLFRAVTVIQQTTTMHYLRLAAEQVNEREDRLRGFNRALSHEFKNRIGAVLGASDLLRHGMVKTDLDRDRMLRMIEDNTREMSTIINNLLQLTRTETDSRKQRHIDLRAAISEVVRQSRDRARQAGVDVRVGDLPEIEVNAAAIELCLSNYLSNAIKYSDPNKAIRWVEVSADAVMKDRGDCELVIRVTDNGLGVPPEAHDDLFKRFFRAHNTVTGVEGTGLGLSIVRETVESLGGRAWAEFPEVGATFALSVPFRRAGEVCE